MITRVAVVPHPPLLVPELAAGAAAETEPLRAATVAVAGELPAKWIAVAADHAGPDTYGPGTSGTFAGYGVDVRVALSGGAGGGEPDPAVPLPVLVTGWLRERVGAEVLRVELVHPETSAAECVSFGRGLTREPGDIGLLVLGDGSTRHGPRSPGGLDERAGPFDQHVRQLLATADVAGLLALDVALARELGAQGRATWQVLAGVRGPWRCAHSEFFAPFGVGYHLAVWERERS